MFLFIALVLLALLTLGLVVWPDASCVNFLTDYIADHLGASNYVFRLFTNNATISTATVLGDLTEATFTGYSSVAGNTVTWTPAALAGHIAQTNGTAIVFNNTSGSPVNIYGVYVTNVANTKLYFVEKDPAAPVSIPAGGSYTYVPNQQFKSIN